ncbi:hypothetical protein Clacol_000305 [Clathrus columnatus]|uniref:Organic hydroperoxide resistance protein n=1 Tax=Clathrus columnatus TaxID=1419009 RepID=A0AAV4ZZC9_9AGAM|nr:hypothetical protein Clacol_000305 [Clathrus columnatus]
MLRSLTVALRVPRSNILTTQKRTILTLKDHKYTAHAIASGAGRNGRVVSNEEGATAIDFTLASPKALGGSGKGHNPEQLFASGYASCFLGALQLVAAQRKQESAVENAKIHTYVHIGEPNETPGFGLAVDIKVEGVEDEDLIHAAHQFCPYSRALNQGIAVTVGKQ